MNPTKQDLPRIVAENLNAYDNLVKDSDQNTSQLLAQCVMKFAKDVSGRSGETAIKWGRVMTIQALRVLAEENPELSISEGLTHIKQN